ncbi:hypothetical protein BDA99DRAFT_442265 [Phascolomyces articulosus]|uniref:Uncharacterized protein n=1 Tax=Phascolomyces articulosus TaxID=60185 RepID=A0AAD5PD53_9FUNG|nr:hypothetical protein BDA99DRAFT_442265 [Phascolomyces articulosus]
MIEEDQKEKQVNDEKEEEEEPEEEMEDRPPMYDLRLIDFAHSTFRSKQEKQDPGILKGLNNVVSLLEECLDRQKKEKL